MAQARSPQQASPATDSGRTIPATGIAADSIYAEIDMRVFSVISLVGSGVATFMGFEALSESRWISSILIFGIVAGVAVNLLIARHHKVPILGLNVLSAIATTLLIAICMISGTRTPPAMMLLSAIPFVFAIIGARRSMLTWLLIIVLALFFLYFFPDLDLNIPVEPRKNLPLIFGLEVAILTLFITMASYTGVRGRRALLDELTRAKIEIEHARDEAVKANEAKSQFLARVSHELRTPLNGIIGFTQILTRDNTNLLNEKQRERLHYVEASAQSLLALVNEILDITHIESGEMSVALGPLDVAGMLKETTGSIEPMAQDASITLSVLPVGELWVLADEQRLRQALANLLSNAIKYNRPRGTVMVAATAGDNEVRITVSDTGHGLRPDEIARLFQPFNRLGAANSAIEGSGLGLVITRTLVERMQGRLEVESIPGSGSRFSIILPRHMAPPVSAEKNVVDDTPPITVIDAPLPDKNTRTVLYVEDNSVNMLLMEAMFERLPQVRLHIAPSGAEGLEAARILRPDLLLLDINLPDCTGIELLAQIRALGSSTALAIAVSADAMPDAIQHALENGFHEYWTKPLDMQQKLQSLSVLLATPVLD